MIGLMAKEPKNDSYSEEETAKRRDATIRAMIAMPPKTHKPKAKQLNTRPKPGAKPE
jgi:hypothetical protein